MTYLELYQNAEHKLNRNKITLGEFEKMIEPLNAEIAQPEYTEQDVRDSFNSGYACGMEATQPETATITIGKTRGTDILWYQCDGCGEPVAKEDCYCSNCGRRLRFE